MRRKTKTLAHIVIYSLLAFCGAIRIFILEPNRFGLEALAGLGQLKPPLYTCSDPPRNHTFEFGDLRLSTEHGQYSGPMHFLRALRNYSSLTHNISTAHLIYINLNCYFRHLLLLHHGKNVPEPRSCSNASCVQDAITSIMFQVTSTQRWVTTSGRDFVLFGPHPLDLGHWSGIDICSDVFQATIIVPDQTRCIDRSSASFFKRQTVIAPYYSYVHHLSVYKEFSPDFRSRHLFLTAHATCGDKSGKLMRDVIFRRLNDAFRAIYAFHNVSISCRSILSDEQHSRLLLSSRYCIVIPGDAQSSQRLSDVIISGCIPVFIGPPFHILPLRHLINYEDMSLFFHVNESSSWFHAGLPINASMQCSLPALDPVCWFDESSSLQGSIVFVDRVESIPSLLHSITADRENELRRGVSFYMRHFLYTDEITSSTERSILDTLRLLYLQDLLSFGPRL